MKTASYLRVSTSDQTCENQRRSIAAWAESAGCTVDHEYVDHGLSGALGRDKRPGLDAMLKDAARRRFTTVVVWSVDRLGRSLPDLIETLNELNAAGVRLVMLQQAIDTSTPSGRAFFSMLGVFAEFERGMIAERVRSGMERAKAQGRHVGRPNKVAVVSDEIRALRDQGMTLRAIADTIGVSLRTVSRALNEEAAA